ncbi:unnamed protein product [Owenia fusiformis]|uniref:EGF-like domain-containing protein n=1 Tax=Owenia fusiformis TaxID=6347 RepID=A0A8S4PHP7_OWEFU|nr:unnamed protein product [Owenia fusiformis]
MKFPSVFKTFILFTVVLNIELARGKNHRASRASNSLSKAEKQVKNLVPSVDVFVAELKQLEGGIKQANGDKKIINKKVQAVSNLGQYLEGKASLIGEHAKNKVRSILDDLLPIVDKILDFLSKLSNSSLLEIITQILKLTSLEDELSKFLAPFKDDPIECTEGELSTGILIQSVKVLIDDLRQFSKDTRRQNSVNAREVHSHANVISVLGKFLKEKVDEQWMKEPRGTTGKRQFKRLRLITRQVINSLDQIQQNDSPDKARLISVLNSGVKRFRKWLTRTKYASKNCTKAEEPKSIKINQCSSSPCKNGGTCDGSDVGFRCSCPKSHTGQLCETEICYLYESVKENRTADKVCFEQLSCCYSKSPFNVLPDHPRDIKLKLLVKEPGSDQYRCLNEHTGHLLDPNKETKLFSHGFLSYGTVEWIRETRGVFSKEFKDDFNLVSIDWEEGAKYLLDYNRASSNGQLVGKMVSTFLMDVLKLDPKRIHCIGHSLGSHVCGFIGKENTLKRITGLDPAGPLFEFFGPDHRLDPTDADFVDAIHTDAWGSGWFNIVDYGIMRPVGHVDFYPNGGGDQPGCRRKRKKRGLSICHHARSTELFKESIDSSCEFIAQPCNLATDNVKQGGCNTIPTCENHHVMGYYADKFKDRHGKYYLVTNSGHPRCIQSHLSSCFISKTLPISIHLTSTTGFPY